MRYRRVLLAVFLILAVLAAEWAWLRAEGGPPPSAGGPAITAHGQSPGGPFSLIDHDGLAVSDETYRGKYLVMVFGYTFCPDVCPTTLNAVAGAMELLGPAAETVQPLFITLDPERDTPAVLADYVTAFHPRAMGLTGSPAQIQQIARDYRVYYSKAEFDDEFYLLDHSAYVYLVGPDGAIVTYLKHDATPRVIATAIESAMARFASVPGPPRKSTRRPRT